MARNLRGTVLTWYNATEARRLLPRKLFWLMERSTLEIPPSESTLLNPFLAQAEREEISDDEFWVPDEVWASRESDRYTESVLEDRYFGGQGNGFKREIGLGGTTLIAVHASIAMFLVVDGQELWQDDPALILAALSLVVLPTTIAIMIPLLWCKRFTFRFLVATAVGFVIFCAFLATGTVKHGLVPLTIYLPIGQAVVWLVAGMFTVTSVASLFSPWTVVDPHQEIGRLPRTGIASLMELPVIVAIVIFIQMLDFSEFSAQDPMRMSFGAAAIGLGVASVLTPLLMYLLRPMRNLVRQWTVTSIVAVIAAGILNAVSLALQTDIDSVFVSLPALSIATFLTASAFIVSLAAQVTVLRFMGWRTINQVEVRGQLQRAKSNHSSVPSVSPLD